MPEAGQIGKPYAKYHLPDSFRFNSTLPDNDEDYAMKILTLNIVRYASQSWLRPDPSSKLSSEI